MVNMNTVDDDAYTYQVRPVAAWVNNLHTVTSVLQDPESRKYTVQVE
jgi:hypothetical protein